MAASFVPAAAGGAIIIRIIDGTLVTSTVFLERIPAAETKRQGHLHI